MDERKSRKSSFVIRTNSYYRISKINRVIICRNAGQKFLYKFGCVCKLGMSENLNYRVLFPIQSGYFGNLSQDKP